MTYIFVIFLLSFEERDLGLCYFMYISTKVMQMQYLFLFLRSSCSQISDDMRNTSINDT